MTKANRSDEDRFDYLFLERLLSRLGASNSKILAETVQHFTEKEGTQRDQIVIDYFGECGITEIVDVISDFLLEDPQMPANGKILDVGAGSGLFTVRIARRVCARLPDAGFYAMDLTPAMLRSLGQKSSKIATFIGIAENIKGSIKEAQSFFKIPQKFDAVFSTLMLHHSAQPEKVFESIKNILKPNGKAAILDMCEHNFEEFRTEMGDIHLGFKPERIHEMARKHFGNVKVEKIPGICCESSGRSAEIFIAKMKNRL